MQCPARAGEGDVSRNQLIDSYQSGRIGRRAFIKGMVGLGMSATLATALADKVRAASTASTAGSDANSDIYDPGTPPTALPATGTGRPASSSKSAGAALTVLAAGAAAAAGILRRKTNTAAEGEQ